MTFSPAFAKASAGKQSQNTYSSTALRVNRSSTTVRILLQPSPSLPAGRQGYGRRSNRKSHIWAQLERNLGKLFYGGA